MPQSVFLFFSPILDYENVAFVCVYAPKCLFVPYYSVCYMSGVLEDIYCSVSKILFLPIELKLFLGGMYYMPRSVFQIFFSIFSSVFFYFERSGFLCMCMHICLAIDTKFCIQFCYSFCVSIQAMEVT